MSRLNQDLLQKLRQAFEKRPVWVKQSLLAQFSEEEQGEMKRLAPVSSSFSRELIHVCPCCCCCSREKVYFPSVAYVINTGVYSKCLVKYGYDPRLDIESRKSVPPRLKKKRGKGKKRKKKEILTAFRLQHIFFYAHKKTVKNPMNTHPENDEEADRREGWWEEEQARLIAEGKRPPIDPTYVPPPRAHLIMLTSFANSKANIFDGQYLHKAKADYQLCDITDPFIMRYIDDTSHLSTTCTVRSPPSIHQTIQLNLCS